MKRGLLLGCLLVLIGELSAQILHVSLPQETVASGETVVLPVTVANFDSIVSLQFSINWDTEVATFDAYELDALPLLAIGDFNATNGELRFSWFDSDGAGRRLDDDTPIAYLTFTAVGTPGASTLVAITGEPLEVQIFKATSVLGQFEPVVLDQDEGLIAIEAPLGFNVELGHVACLGVDDGYIMAGIEGNMEDYQFNWTGPDDFMDTGLSLSNLSGGTYLLTISNLSGDVVYTYEAIIQSPAEVLDIADLVIVNTDCIEPTGSVSVSLVGGVSPYIYQLNGENTTDGIFEGLAAGDYTLALADANGCTLNGAIEITSPDAPQVDLPELVSICGEGVVLDATTSGASSYLWSTGAMSESITVEEAGDYAVTVTNDEGCSTIRELVAAADTPPVGVLDNDFLEVCPGDSLQLVVSGGLSYEWLTGQGSLSDPSVSTPIAILDTTTLYQVAVGNDCGTDTLAFEVVVFDVLANAGEDICVIPGEEGQLMASGGIFYKWEDNKYPVSDTEVQNPVIMPVDSTTYQVSIIDVNGCLTIDDVVVLVAEDPAATITPYNLITPNGDGWNDSLDFDDIGKYGANSLKIYSRWGELVYQKLNYQADEERFDGYLNGQQLPAGNYFYVLAFRQGEVKQTLSIIWE